MLKKLIIIFFKELKKWKIKPTVNNKEENLVKIQRLLTTHTVKGRRH